MKKVVTLLVIGVVLVLALAGTKRFGGVLTGAEPVAPLVGSAFEMPAGFTIPVTFQAKKITIPAVSGASGEGGLSEGPWAADIEPERIATEFPDLLERVVAEGRPCATTVSPLESPCLRMRASTSGLLSFGVFPATDAYMSFSSTGSGLDMERRYWVTQHDMTTKTPTIGDLSAHMPGGMNEIRLGIHGESLATDAALIATIDEDGALIFFVGITNQ